MLRYIDYDVLNKHATDFSNYSSELNTIITNLKGTISSIDKYWISNNKETFNLKLNTVIDNMQVDSNKIKRYSNILLGAEDDFKSQDLTYQSTINSDKMEN